MKKITALLLILSLFVSASGITAYGEDTAVDNKSANVKVDVAFPDGVPGFLIVDEDTLKSALADDSFSVLPVQNDIVLESGVPLTVDSGRKCTIISATGAPISITQTVPGQPHFKMYWKDDMEITFDGKIILDGDSIGGGVAFTGKLSPEQEGAAKITKAIIQNCKGSNGAGIYMSLFNLTLTDCVLRNNVATGKGGAIYSTHDASVLTINGGKINDNKANIGAGIYVDGGTTILNNAEILDNTATNNAGGIFTQYKLDMNGGKVTGNTASSTASGNGGGVFVGAGGTFTVNDVEITNNTAKADGGGVYISENGLYYNIGDVTYSGNTARKAYWITKDGAEITYNGNTADALKNFYDTNMKSHVKSLSAPPTGCAVFTYAFNNFDVNYVGSAWAGVSPGAEKLIFDESTEIGSLEYSAVAGDEQWSALSSADKPVIAVFNTTNELWKVQVSYTTFTDKYDAEIDGISFALRGDDGEYELIESGVPNRVYTATEAWTPGYVTTIPWVEDGKDLLAVHLPANRYDIGKQELFTVVYFVLQPVVA